MGILNFYFTRFRSRACAAFAALAVSSVFHVPPAARAQSPPAFPQSIIRQQQEILQRNEQERREQIRRRELEMLRPGGASLKSAPPPSAPVAPGACFEVQTITLQGNTRLSADRLDEGLAPFQGRCLGLADLDDLLRSLSAAYVERGYVAARVYVPEQQIASGQLRLEVVEGRVAALRLNDDEGGWQRWRLATAFPGMEGGVVDLRAIEQGLDQMNRVRSVDTTMELQPGALPGDSVLALRQQRGRPWYGTVGFDNAGDRSSGVWRLNAGLGLGNGIGINDLWSLSASHTLPERPRRSARSLAGTVSIPWGYWTVSLSASTFTYHSLIETRQQRFKSRGHSHTASLSVDRVLDRNESDKTVARAGLSRKWSMSYIDDVRLLSGDRDLSILSFGLDHSRRLGGGLLSLGVGYERGLRLLGAMKDGAAASEVPRAQFDKFTADVSYYRPFSAGQQDFAYRLDAHAQHSPQTLYASERIGIAQAGAVRGFRDGALLGDTGLFGRNELQWMGPVVGPALRPVLGQPALYLGYDRGWLKKDRHDPFERGAVSGAALGLRSSGSTVSFDVSVARVLSAPAFMEKEKSFYASISLTY